MAKTPLQFGEWRPDLALLDNQFTADAENVFADGNSYKPIPGLSPLSNATVPDPPFVGLVSARMPNGDWTIFGGTRQKLYKFTLLSGWTDVSRTTGGAYHVPDGELWSFDSFGDQLVAVNIADAPQVISITSGTNFAALGGSPPIAHNVKQIGDFLFLGGLASNRRIIQWSAINNITNWTPGGTGLGDTQEFPDGGPVQGVSGSESGFYVVQDRAIRRGQFLPGDTTFVFNFSRVIEDKGSISEYGFVTVADILYFLAEDGFYALAGNQLNPIGQDAVNEWFLANSDIGRRNLVQIIPTNRPYVVWAYHSNSATPVYDKVIIYNWFNQRWTRGSIQAFMWAMLASVSLDLDTDGSEPGDAFLDSGPGWAPPPSGAGTPWPAGSPAPRSLDSFAYQGGRPLVSAIDQNGHLCSLSGPNLQATMETVEAHLVPGQRAFVSEVYPLIDGTSATDIAVSTATRERLQDPVVWGLPTVLEVTGAASVLTSARLHRFRAIVPAADTWTHAQGLLVEAQPDGFA